MTPPATADDVIYLLLSEGGIMEVMCSKTALFVSLWLVADAAALSLYEGALHTEPQSSRRSSSGLLGLNPYRLGK